MADLQSRMILVIAMGSILGAFIASWLLANITLIAGDYYKRLGGWQLVGKDHAFELPKRSAAYKSAKLCVFLSLGLVLLAVQVPRPVQPQPPAVILASLVVLSIPLTLIGLQIIVFRRLFNTCLLNAMGITATYFGLLAFIAAITLGPVAALIYYLNNT